MTTAESNLHMASAIQMSSQNNQANVFASMPQDVLLLIFGEELYDIHTVGNSLGTRCPIWSLGQVCMHWRQTLRSHPRFWSRFQAVFSASPTIKPQAFERRFRELIRLSGTTPLHIGVYMAASSTCDLGDRIAGALREVSGRLVELGISFASSNEPPEVRECLSLPLPLLQSELLKNHVFSALHTLNLAIPFAHARLQDVDIRVDAFEKCPLLRSVSLREETHRVEFVLPYQNLTTVHANGGRLDYVINRLERPRDVYLNFFPIALSRVQPPPIPLHSTMAWQAAALRTLKKVRFRSFLLDEHAAFGNNTFCSLHAHALRTLELDAASCLTQFEILTMIPDITLCGLHELIVGCVLKSPMRWNGPDVQSFIHLIARMPALRTLKISGRFGHNVLDALAERDGLVPELVVLTVNAELLENDCAKMVRFVRKRRDSALSVEVMVSTSHTYRGREERFLPDILGSEAAIFWEELVALVPVHVL